MEIKKLNYLLYMLITAIATVKPEMLCDITSKDNTKICYRKEVLANLPHSPNQIAVDRLNNNVYFSFDSGQGEYFPARFKIGESVIYVLKGVKDAFALAYDNTTTEMYFGGSHGIYKYNLIDKKLKHLAIENLDVWWLVVRKNIYFIKFPSLTAFTYENKSIHYMPELKTHNVHQFVFDNDNNIYFINNTGLYEINHGDDAAFLITDFPRFLGMATDNDGLVYLCSEDGIYVMTKTVPKLKRVLSLQGVLGLTFDQNNNIIYSDSHELVRLLPTNNMSDFYLKTDD